jgi:hypothetical protein
MMRSDSVATFALGAASVLIAAASAAFLVWSVLNGTTFHVLNADLPGFLFAGVGIWLGIRSLRATIKLAARIRGKEFHWRNFGGNEK